MGIIDSHSEYSLYDIVDGTLGFEDHQPAGSVEFYGFHILPVSQNKNEYIVQYDGHIGTIDTIRSEEYDDVLELVDDLMTHVFEAHHHDYQGTKKEFVEWAGKIMTDNKQKAEENPELYIHTEYSKGP